MITPLVQYGSALVVLVVADAIWLGLVVRGFYMDQMGSLMRDPVAFGPAVLFYLVYAIGLAVLAVAPASASGAWTTAALNGAVLGLAAYATYNLTGLAVIAGFPTALAVIDIAWGAALSALAATAGYWISRAILGG